MVTTVETQKNIVEYPEGSIICDTDQLSKYIEKFGEGFLNEVKPLLKYYNRKPFKEHVKEKWIDKFKVDLRFINMDFEEEINIKSPKIKPTKEIFQSLIAIFKKYLDTSELNYILLAIWTLGTYFHHQVETYPLLTLMARKRSGKTRTLKLVSSLSFGGDGNTSTSVTETFLFRHKKGAVFFDEMESISSREKTALRETINSVYKRGNKIVRYTEKLVDGKKEYVEENFYPYYPLGLANIYGFGDVLTDRAIQIILQRSEKSQTKLIEDFSTNTDIIDLKNLLSQLNINAQKSVFSEWNDFIQTGKTSKEFKEMFDIISKTNLSGRPLELFFPLFLVAEKFGVFSKLIKCAEDYMAFQEGEFLDNSDDLLQNFMDNSNYPGYVNQSDILRDFKSNLEETEDYMNPKWFGRALKRLGLIKRKRLVNGRVQVELNTNTTYTTNSTNTTNTTNTTKKQVELGEFVEFSELIDQKPEIEIIKVGKKELLK